MQNSCALFAASQPEAACGDRDVGWSPVQPLFWSLAITTASLQAMCRHVAMSLCLDGVLCETSLGLKTANGGDRVYLNSVTLGHSGSLCLPWLETIARTRMTNAPLHLRGELAPPSGRQITKRSCGNAQRAADSGGSPTDYHSAADGRKALNPKYEIRSGCGIFARREDSERY